MASVLRLVLILCMTLTGVGLGMARGTVMSGGQVVICTGQGVVIRHLPGAPGKTTAHICPDMALSFIGATAMADIGVTRQAVRYRPAMLPEATTEVSRLLPLATARDPPRRSLKT